MFNLNISFQRKHQKFEDNIRAGISTPVSKKRSSYLNKDQLKNKNILIM